MLRAYMEKKVNNGELTNYLTINIILQTISKNQSCIKKKGKCYHNYSLQTKISTYKRKSQS